MAAEELNMKKLEELKRQVESLGLDKKQRNKLITDEWRRMREAETEERRLAAQAEERRIAAEERRIAAEAEERRLAAQVEERRIEAEAEERRIAAEAEERRLAAQAEERRLAAEERRTAAEERKAELKVEKLRLELEAWRLSQSQNGEQLNEGSVGSVVRTPRLPSFVDGKDNRDDYLLRFERYASVAKWNRSTWATQLSSLLTGKAVEVYNRLSPEEAMDYERLTVALLERYDFTERGYREKFGEARPEGHESPSQFRFRLKNYFTKWVELAEVEQTFMGVVDLVVREQFTSSCFKDLSIWLKQSNPKTLDKLSRLADQYLAARNQKLSSKEVIKRGSARAGVKDNHSGFPPASTLKCFLCNRVGHRAIDCRVKSEEGRNEHNRPARHAVTCYQCGEIGHEKRYCRNAPRPQAAPRGGGNTLRPPSQPYRVGCTAQVGRLSDDVKAKDEEYLELKSGKKIKVVRNGACLSNENKSCMPLATGKVGENEVEVLRDTGCNSVIVRRKLVKKEDFTGSMGYVMAIDRILKEAPIAEIKVDTSYYTGVTQAICLRDPLFDLVIGNIPGARNPDDPVSGMETCAAAVTRAQARKDITVKPLVTKEVTTQTSITKNELAKLQQEDTTLEKYADLEDAVRKGDYEIKYKRRSGVLYRLRNRVDGLGECSKQIMVPKTLRRKVMEVAHDSIFGGHLGIKKTKDRIQTNFYWPGMQGDVTSFCRSCDVCQKTTAKGSVPRVPLGDMLLIDMPFRRVAVDLVGPISPPSEKGHRYILILVDYATRYPEAVPLKNIETETVAEALLDMYSRLGIPEEVPSDLGTQFVSKCMEEVSRLQSIKRLTTTPYHPICNGLVERFNGTLKKMLRRLCNEQPRQWLRFVNPLLFAYREATQEATGFSPFELYGRTVRGPVQILKELWTGETGGTEVKTSYQYVFELRERLNNTMKIAQEELLKSRRKNKALYDRRAKRREFQEGDKVLLLLPTATNKLLMQWKGPYEIMSRCGKGNDYRIEANKKVKTFHANMLKKYIERDDQDGAPQQNSDNNQIMSCEAGTRIIEKNEDISVNDDEMINTLRRPTTKEEVRLFLGLANYYRAHIPTFAAVAAPLTDLTPKGQPNKIRWGKLKKKPSAACKTVY